MEWHQLFGLACFCQHHRYTFVALVHAAVARTVLLARKLRRSFTLVALLHLQLSQETITK